MRTRDWQPLTEELQDRLDHARHFVWRIFDDGTLPECAGEVSMDTPHHLVAFVNAREKNETRNCGYEIISYDKDGNQL